MEGWIKLHRELRESPIFQNEKLLKVFVWCLLKANPSPERWKGIEIKAGQFVTSLSRSVAETGLSQKTIRNALRKLEKMGELVTQKSRAYTIITICNYESYQGDTTDEGTQGAHEMKFKLSGFEDEYFFTAN